MQTQTLPILGGQYTARVYPDGSADILHVPIFGELEAFARRNQQPIGEEWHRAAWRADQQLAAQQYLPPAHVGHHDDGTPTRRAGFFRIVDVRRSLYRGRLQSTVFADFLRIPADIFARIRAGELPYVSAEICRWDRPEIASVALLSDEAPAFKFPLLTVGRVERVESFRAHTVRYCFADFETPPMPDDKKQNEKFVPEPAPEPAPADTQPAPMAEPELPAWAPALAKLIAAEVARALNQPIDTGPAKAPVAPEDLGAQQFADRRVIALEAEVAAMRTREAQRQAREQVAARLARAQESLRGYQIDDATRATLAKFAERGDDVLNEFVEAFRRTATQDPPETLAEYSRHQPALEKFRAQGPETLEAAKRLLPQYEALRARRAVSVSFDDFVAANLNPYAPL